MKDIQGLNEIRKVNDNYKSENSKSSEWDKKEAINKKLVEAISDGEISFGECIDIRHLTGGGNQLAELLHGRVADEVIDGLKNDGMDEKQIKEILEKIKNNTLKNERDSKLINEDTAVAPEKDTSKKEIVDDKNFGV